MHAQLPRAEAARFEFGRHLISVVFVVAGNDGHLDVGKCMPEHLDALTSPWHVSPATMTRSVPLTRGGMDALP
jgi:hypothetical protein